MTIGIELGITIFIFVYAGHRLDLYYNKRPVFLIIGTVLGMVLGFYHLMKQLQQQTEIEKEEKEKPEEKKTRWM